MKKLCLALFTGLTAVVLTATLDVTGNWEVEATFDDSSIPRRPRPFCARVAANGGSCWRYSLERFANRTTDRELSSPAAPQDNHAGLAEEDTPVLDSPRLVNGDC